MPDPIIPGGENVSGGAADDKNQVSHETHQRLLSEKKKEQEARRAAEAELEKLRKEKEDREKAEAEQQGNWKKLLDAEREKNKQIADENSAIKSSIMDAKRKSAVLRLINGVVPAEVVDKLLDANQVIVDESGQVDIESAKLVAQEFEKTYPYVIQRDNKNGGLPPGAPRGGSNKISYADWQKLSAAEMKKQIGNVDWPNDN